MELQCRCGPSSTEHVEAIVVSILRNWHGNCGQLHGNENLNNNGNGSFWHWGVVGVWWGRGVAGGACNCGIHGNARALYALRPARCSGRKADTRRLAVIRSRNARAHDKGIFVVATLLLFQVAVYMVVNALAYITPSSTPPCTVLWGGLRPQVADLRVVVAMMGEL